jgi:hypothetical protein
MPRAAPKRLFPELAGYEALFRNTGIETRYTCEPPDWYEREHGWEERTGVFLRHAQDLLEEVALGAVGAAGIELKDIGAIVVNTITGLAIPSLDAKLMNGLDLPASVERLPIFGLGCGGGVGGLARAARYAQAMPGAHVLFLTIDLCSLCLRVNDPSMAMFVSAALFGDLQHEIIGDERPDDDSVGWDQKEQRGDPGEMRRRHDRIERGASLATAFGKERLGVARRIKFFEPALGEQEDGRDLRRTDEVEQWQFQLQAKATLRKEMSPKRSAPSATGLPPRLR